MSSVKPIRTRSLEVLGLSMSRSGTMSTSHALQILGYDYVYHGFQVGMHNDGADIPVWDELGRHKFFGHGKSDGRHEITKDDLDRLFFDVGAVTDTPCVMFWEELMEAYPAAKVVLTQRDPEKWFESFDRVVIDSLFHWRTNFFCKYLAWAVPAPNAFSLLQMYYLSHFGARDVAELKAKAKDGYVLHNERIKAKAKELGRPLLEFDLATGWGPLCEFLGRPVPAKEFPRSNEGDHARETVRWAVRLFEKWALMRIAATATIITVPIVAVRILSTRR